ncbi:uncharacterized protein [Panulirus ornatus]|uniref:uncharacterized protein isoform X4 n=1 Tax=Panulirus ornatus TaxID=150431 RepID=UPI003A86F40C
MTLYERCNCLNFGGWKKLQRSDHRLGAYEPEAGMQSGNEVKGRVPAALVHPFPLGERADVMEKENSLPSFIHRPHHHDATNLPSPYLLSLQTPSPSTPVSRVRSPPSVTVNFDHVLHCSPNSHDIELKSLHYQVQEIKNKLTTDVTGSSEYQQLLSEKLHLEETLGSTEYALQQLRTAYNDLKKSTTASEKEFSHELGSLQEKHRLLGEKYSAASDQLMKLKEYLRDLPTLNEHQQLQQEIAQKSAQISHLSSKVDHCSQQVRKLARKENEQAATIDSLAQERDDLSLKLSLTENILKELESQRAAACEEGQHSREDLLWRLGQSNKELESAKKLLNYRKQKLMSLHKELMEQDKKYTDKLHAEIEQGEKLRETVWQLEKDLEKHKLTEDKMKSKLVSVEEKQKRTEERLEVALEQVALQFEMSSVITAFLSCLNTAVHQVKDFVTVSRQISQGHSPDISLLLKLSDEYESGSLTLEDLTSKFTELQGLTKELEDVRTQLQEQYAHQLAKDVTCAQMPLQSATTNSWDHKSQSAVRVQGA